MTQRLRAAWGSISAQISSGRTASGVVRNSSELLVVAAGTAWPFYRLTSAYVCQAGRSFRPTERIAFYSNKTIHGVAAVIQSVFDHETLSEASAARLSMSVAPHERRMGNVMAAALAGPWKEGGASKVLLLSGPGDPDTLTFRPVTHRGAAAWTMGHRYTDLASLMSATSTDDLSDQAVGRAYR